MWIISAFCVQRRIYWLRLTFFSTTVILFSRSQNFCINKYKFYLFWFRYNSFCWKFTRSSFFMFHCSNFCWFYFHFEIVRMSSPYGDCLYWYQKAIENLLPLHKKNEPFYVLFRLAFASVHNLQARFLLLADAFCQFVCKCLNFKMKNNEEETELLTKLKAVTWGGNKLKSRQWGSKKEPLPFDIQPLRFGFLFCIAFSALVRSSRHHSKLLQSNKSEGSEGEIKKLFLWHYINFFSINKSWTLHKLLRWEWDGEKRNEKSSRLKVPTGKGSRKVFLGQFKLEKRDIWCNRESLKVTSPGVGS